MAFFISQQTPPPLPLRLTGYHRVLHGEVRGWWNSQIVPKSPEQLEKMRRAGRVAHAALDLAETLIEVGRTTEEMDKELHTFICALVKMCWIVWDIYKNLVCVHISSLLQ